MGKRSLFLGAALVLIVVLAWPSLRSETASALDIFFWLFAMLVVSALALWPSTGRDQRAELLSDAAGQAGAPRLGRPHRVPQGRRAGWSLAVLGRGLTFAHYKLFSYELFR